jgi:phage terminase Nu1 subunit (DNA packaging protein)
MPEVEVTQSEFAELIGVSTRTVFNLRDAGLNDYCVTKGKSVKVRIPSGIQWYVRYKESMAAEKSTPSSLAQAELDYAVARAEGMRADVDRKKAKLIERALIEPWVGDMLSRVRSRLDALPVKIAQGVTAEKERDRRKQAAALVTEVLEELRLGPMPTGNEEEDES